MALSNLMNWLNPRARRNEEARQDLKANAEKALRMKQEAETDKRIPPHQTAREGMQPAQDPHMSDATRGAEAGFTPQLKRSRVARSGDT
jgi:hypothetical protein